MWGVFDAMTKTPRLSKSRFQTGLQCPKALWLQCYRPELAGAVSEMQQAIFDNGHRVGELARERFPGGVLVAEDFRQSAAALATTRRHLAGPWPCLFEAAFSHDDLFVRPDVLVHSDDGSCHLIEVKSSTGVKPEHVTDAAVQRWVLEGAGLAVTACRCCISTRPTATPGDPTTWRRCSHSTTSLRRSTSTCRSCPSRSRGCGRHFGRSAPSC